MSRTSLGLLTCMRGCSHCDKMVALIDYYYFELKETIDELDLYHPLILDLKVLQQYHDELAMAKFLSGLDTSLGNQIRRQILGGDTIPPLTMT